MDDGGIALDPHPATMLGQEPVVLSGHLAFHQHWGHNEMKRWAELGFSLVDRNCGGVYRQVVNVFFTDVCRNVYLCVCVCV